MDDRTLILFDKDGNEIVTKILFTYHSDEYNNDYVVFYNEKINEISAACYNPNDGDKGELSEVKTEEEWKMLEEILNDYAENNQGCPGCGGCEGSCGSCECDCEEDCEGCN